MSQHESFPDKPAWEKYLAWLRTECEETVLLTAESRYGAVTAKVKVDIEAGAVWQRLLAQCDDLDDRYTSDTGFKLFATPEPPLISIKSYRSLLHKSYRKNVLFNDQWPAPPNDGWITPLNWFTRLNDMVRTTMVVKYLDGVQFLVDRLRVLAGEHGHEFQADYEAREEGYYAAHCYIGFEVETPKLDWDTERIQVTLEIQVTTQVQDVIRKLTHAHYEERRTRAAPPDLKWQWDYSSSEFVPNYLGHILHYVEGMIMEVRSRGARDATS